MRPVALATGLALAACTSPPTAGRPVVAEVASVARASKPPPAAPPRAPPATALPPLAWIIGDGGANGFVPAGPGASTSFHVVSDGRGVRSVLREQGRAAITISPGHLCAAKAAFLAHAGAFSLDLDHMSPLSDDAVACVREIRPRALSFSAPSAPELSPPLMALLTHLDGVEALGVDGASDAIAKLLGERAKEPDGARLVIVNLVHGRISADGFRALARREGLRALGFRGVSALGAKGETGIAALADLPLLEQIDLSYGPVTDGDLAAFSRAKRLEVLSLESTAVGDDGVVALAQVKTLRRLQLDFTQMGDRALAALAALPSLTELALRRTSVTDRGARALVTMTSIEKLYLASTQVTEASLDGLVTLPKLRLLDLPDTWSVAAVERFKRARPEVEVWHHPQTP